MQADATNEDSNSQKIWSLTKGFELLSDDLIIEILSWLPVKCLTRYKIVCKMWCILIKSRKFIEKHMQQAKCHILKINELNLPPDPNQQPYKPLFHIHGLLLEQSRIQGNYCIRNHATNQVLVLPEHESRRSWASMIYLASSDKYMVLSLQGRGDHAELCLKVFIIGVDITWRTVEVPISYCGNKKDIIYSKTIDEVNYIMKCCNIKCCQSHIIAFHAKDESFVEIPMPLRVEILSYTWSQFKFITWDNKLALLWFLEGGLHVWVLQDHKKVEWDERKIDFPSSVINIYPHIKNYIPYIILGNILSMLIPDTQFQLHYNIESNQALWVSDICNSVKDSLVSLI